MTYVVLELCCGCCHLFTMIIRSALVTLVNVCENDCAQETTGSKSRNVHVDYARCIQTDVQRLKAAASLSWMICA